MPYFDSGDKCLKCGGPMVFEGCQYIPFCWECAVNRELARRAYALMARIQAKEAA